ncbi:DUF7504 family protein [Natronolimnohabitans innermongolicus]|uniref:Uncharacterized protein n=1 Tax=Natronolimnohabitans innermongolicus JCM 12255 TaxID=1227499 RepID=L9X4X5_9EURY|nr:hypothetical protein [Natronolimnohabitans innermongolicus]ELY56672.1 hypothetical protein C493_09870 [Natronolimnohabitans innermongolicus JCM 12255]
MFSRKDWGDGSDEERFSGELARLKRQGASILVVGAVQRAHRRAICRRLFGQATTQPRRRLFVSTTGDCRRTSTLFDEATASDHHAFISYEAHSRSAGAAAGNVETDVELDAGSKPESNPNPYSIGADDSSTDPQSDPLSATEVTSLAELGIAISNAIETFETESNGLAPAELRIGIESLAPLLEAYGAERVFKFVHLTNGRTRDIDGMIHYHLPMKRDTDVVSVLTPLFDIVIELREHNDTAQQRWTINDGTCSSGWLPIEQS